MSQAIRRLTIAADAARRDRWEHEQNVIRVQERLKELRAQIEKAEAGLAQLEVHVAEGAAAEAAIREAIAFLEAREQRIRLYGSDPITSTTIE